MDAGQEFRWLSPPSTRPWCWMRRGLGEHAQQFLDIDQTPEDLVITLRLLAIPARIVRGQRLRTLRLPRHWPWSNALVQIINTIRQPPLPRPGYGHTTDPRKGDPGRPRPPPRQSAHPSAQTTNQSIYIEIAEPIKPGRRTDEVSGLTTRPFQE